MKQKSCFQNKVRFNSINLLDIGNILDKNAENLFFQNISSEKQLDSKKEEKNKKSNILYDYLKNGRFDYSLDSNSNSNKEENQKDKIKEKKSKKQNFILKSELFNSSPNIEQKIRSEKLSPKSSVLK